MISQKGCNGSMVVTPNASKKGLLSAAEQSLKGGRGVVNMTVGDEDGKTLGSGFPHKLRCQYVSGILHFVILIILKGTSHLRKPACRKHVKG